MSNEDAIEVLRGLIREANANAESAKQIFAAPYSSYESDVRFRTARGVAEGVARCIEALLVLPRRCEKFPSEGFRCVLVAGHEPLMCRQFAGRGECSL